MSRPHRSRIRFAFLMTAGTMVAAPAAAQQDGEWVDPATGPARQSSWFVRNSIGANLLDSVSLEDRSVNGESATGVNIKFKTGFAWGIDVGYRLNDLVSVELSSGIAYNEMDSISGTLDLISGPISGTNPLGGSLYQVPLMAGIAFDLPLYRAAPGTDGSNVYLRLGASAGGAYLHGKLDDQLGFIGGSDSDFTWAYGLTAALDWQISSQLTIGVAYRFLGTGQASFSGFGVADLFEFSNTNNSQLMGSISLSF